MMVPKILLKTVATYCVLHTIQLWYGLRKLKCIIQQCNSMIGWRHIFVMNEHTLHIQCIFWRLITCRVVAAQFQYPPRPRRCRAAAPIAKQCKWSFFLSFILSSFLAPLLKYLNHYFNLHVSQSDHALVCQSNSRVISKKHIGWTTELKLINVWSLISAWGNYSFQYF